MKKFLMISAFVFSLTSNTAGQVSDSAKAGQISPTEEAQPIVAEGKLLYKYEMASWFGTDLFLEKYKNQENIGGYFSYLDYDTAKCIFFSKAETPKVIGTISFDSTYNINRAKINLSERDFTAYENDLYLIRKNAINEIAVDTFFKSYTNTRLNLIPMIKDNEKKVYILTGPQQTGIVIFGNDYLLTFDNNNQLLTKKRLHNNIIPIEYGNIKKGKKVEGSMHSHLPETGDFITATDICTLMLYAKYANWKTHNVVSKEYLNMWNCETNTLVVIPMKTIDKIDKDQKKRHKKNKNTE